MRNTTVGAMVAAVRLRCDLKTDQGHITDPDIKGWLSAGYAELYDLLVNSGLAFFESTQTIVSDGVNASFALPSDYFGTLRIDYQYNTEIIWPVKEISPRQIHRVLQRTSTQRAFFYRTVGNTTVFYPRPPGAQTYLHLYIPVAADLSATIDATVVDGIQGWEDYPIEFACILACEARKEDIGTHLRLLGALQKRIEAAAQNRAIASATSLVDDTDPFASWEQDPANWRQS